MRSICLLRRMGGCNVDKYDYGIRRNLINFPKTRSTFSVFFRLKSESDSAMIRYCGAGDVSINDRHQQFFRHKPII